MARKPPITIAPGQVWTPKRGTYSLRVISVDTVRDDIRVQKFSPSGIYEPPVSGPHEVTVRTRTIRGDYTLQESKS